MASWRSSRTGTPDQLEGQRGEDEVVGQRVDLDEGVAPAAVGAGRRPERPNQEGAVLGQVHGQAGALVAPHGQAAQVHARDDGRGPLARPSQAEDVDFPAGSDERLGLAPDACVLLVVGVDDHADRAGAACVAVTAPPRQRPRGQRGGDPLGGARAGEAAGPRRARPPACRFGPAGARAESSRDAPASRSSPTSTAELPAPPTVSTHSVVERRTRHGTPSQADSRWTPPESVSTAAAWSWSARDVR